MHSILLNLFNVRMLPITLNIILYIDPGTGSIILQAVAAAVAGVAIAVKLYWHQLLIFFGLRKNSEPDPRGTADENEE